MSGLISAEECEALALKVQNRHIELENFRLAPPDIRIWDGDMNLRSWVAGWRAVDYEFIENDTGTCELEMPLDHHVTQWLLLHRGRAKRNVIITIDKQGTRWSGVMDSYRVVKKKGGDRFVSIIFKHDFEQLKHIRVWCNPFLLPNFQFPKLWLIFGPSKFCLWITLFVNLFRLESSLWTLPDDPTDILEWMGPSFNVSQWRNVLKPYDVFSDNSNTTIVFSRFQTFFEIAEMVLADAQLTMTCRRYLDGDPHPFADLDGTLADNGYVEGVASLLPLRHGCVVWDIQDKSGWGTGTAFGGSILTGLLRTLVTIQSDGYTEGVDIYTGDQTDPQDYYAPWFLGTNPRVPWVIFEEGLWNPIEESEFEYYEATDTSFLCGGRSQPGINEAISAAINMAGDFLTSVLNSQIAAASSASNPPLGGEAVPPLDIPPLGGLMDAVAKPFYEDVINAFQDVPTLRAVGTTLPISGLEDVVTGLGDFHYFEDMVDEEMKAWTLGAFAATRARIWETRARHSHTIKVPDAAPYIVGETGYGHFFLGDRVATTVLGYPTPDTLFVERVKKVKYAWDKDGPKGWTLEIGYKEHLDPAFKALEFIKKINSTFAQTGIL